MAAALVVSLGLQWTGTFALFALGQMLFGSWPAGFALAGVALVAGFLLSRRLE
ncbi:MAG: hypothetical protein M3468_07770 [Acidobacteriota bacterium]|nr:hypothetical protein [Acidobacteriota bacterium]